MSFFKAAEELYSRAITHSITERDLDAIIEWPVERLAVLFACSDQVRRHFFSDRVDPCSLLNIKSGNCSENCAFCAQSSHNKAEVRIHGLVSKEEIIAAATRAHGRGCSFCVVSSGRKLSPAEIRTVADALHECRGPVHASLGILTDEEFTLLKQAGVVCYNHNLETSREFFPAIVTTHTFEERVATVRRAKKAGIKVCCGGIFGMGESWADRKSLCRELKALDVDTIPQFPQRPSRNPG
jgi:biotin synthase